jgi:hypothetical protein
MSKKWTNEELSLLKVKWPITTKQEVISLFPNRTWRSIESMASRLKIKKLDSSYGRPNNLEILLNNSKLSMYWLGFILADGHIENESRLKINLSIKDKNHLEKFAIYTDCLLKEYRLNSQYPIISINTTNSKIIPLVSERFNITNDKTYNPPKFINYSLTTEQWISLIIGFIDGDGHIQVERTYPRIQISCYKTWMDNLIFIEEKVYSMFPYTKKIKQLTHLKDGKAFLQFSNSSQVKDLKRFAIENKLPILERKWDKVSLV